MIDKNFGIQQKMVVNTNENLMSQDHFLRKLDSVINFDFIYDIAAPLYSCTGRRSIDPVIIVKMMLLCYIYGIHSEHRLEKEVQVNSSVGPLCPVPKVLSFYKLEELYEKICVFF